MLKITVKLGRFDYLALGLLVITVGCGAPKSSSISKKGALQLSAPNLDPTDHSAEVIPAAEPAPAPAPPVYISVPSELAGAWEVGCKVLGGDDEEVGSYSAVREMKLGTNGELSIDLSYYTGTRCNSRRLVYETRVEGEFLLTSDSIQSKDGVKTYITYYDQASIDQNNEEKECGSADWKYGVEHVDCLSQQGADVLDSQYALDENGLSIYACPSENLDECEADLYRRRSQ